MVSVKINRGITSETPLNEVPPEDQPEVMSWRRRTAERKIPLDCRALLFYVKDGESSENWGGYGSRESYIKNGLGIEPLIVDWAITGLKLYQGETMPIPLHDAVERGRPSNILASAPDLPKHGQYGNGRSRADNISSTRHGTDQIYLAARIKRDRPDIAERIDEYSSVYAAAVDAGIIKPHTPLVVLRKTWEKASPVEREEFLKEIGVTQKVEVLDDPKKVPNRRPSRRR